MLSYHHAYHAGNFADVLKHSITIHILNYMMQKPKPVFYLDTHAGTGAYALNTDEALKNKEFDNGIGKLWPQRESLSKLPNLISEYLKQINHFNPSNELCHYPGSPWLAQQLLREQDRLALYELHPQAFKALSENFANDKRIKAYQSDGFQACLSQLPPKERRGLVLMDPPYEIKQDYQMVAETLIKAHKKFATGTYVLWYPVVDRFRIKALTNQFIQSGIRNIVLFELGINKDGEKGMTSSGMIVINPPWTLVKTVKEALPFLAQTLAGNKGQFSIKQLVDE